MQQATLAIRARVPLDVLADTIQPFPTFSEIYVEALKGLRAEIAPARERVGAAADRISDPRPGDGTGTSAASPSASAPRP